MTIVCDIDRGIVEHISEDRKQESLEQYYQGLTTEQKGAIKAVAMDMWDPYVAATKNISLMLKKKSSMIVFIS